MGTRASFTPSQVDAIRSPQTSWALVTRRDASLADAENYSNGCPIFAVFEGYGHAFAFVARDSQVDWIHGRFGSGGWGVSFHHDWESVSSWAADAVGAWL